MLLIIKLFKYNIYPRYRGPVWSGEGLCPSGPGLIPLSTRDRGLVWSGGGAVSQWARPDPTVNKTTTTLFLVSF